MIKELERFKGETIKCHYGLKEDRNKSATENMQENTKVQLNEIKKRQFRLEKCIERNTEAI